MFDLVQFGESCADERRDIVVFHQIVLLQDEQILPCLEILAAAAVDIAQEHQCARQPVLLLGVHLGELHHLGFRVLHVSGFVITLRQQVFGLRALRRTHFLG